MLQFIFGRASSGKTTYIHSLIEKEIGDDIILLVPEQYTFETEKQMLRIFGGGFMSKVNVLSFSRMCESVGQAYGGISGLRIDDSQRIILMSRAIKNCALKLSLFKRYIKNSEFVKQVADIISEFKLAGISEERIFAVVDKINNPTLKLKLTEIAEIYASYNLLLSKIYIDPLDDIQSLIKKATETDYLKGKTIYIDAFKGFTGAQIKLLKLMIIKCKKVVISFCADKPSNVQSDVGVFSNIQKTADSLLKYAQNNHIEIAENIVLKDSHFNAHELKYLEKVLSENLNTPIEKCENVIIGSLLNPYFEVEYVLKSIHFLVRTKGYRFSDFVIISRNIEKYERMLEAAQDKFKVPCYLDKRKSLASSPIARLVISSLKAARKMETESILMLLKTGLLGFSDSEISSLEEYTYIWGISSEDWCSEWTMDPDGMVTGDYKTDPELLKQRLFELNELRKRVIIPILSLRSILSGTVREISKAVYGFLMAFNVNETVKTRCKELKLTGSHDDSDFLKDSWDTLMNILDNVVRCYNDEKITPDEYIDTLTLAFLDASVGTIPRTLDEVICGNADRIRTASPKISFIIGVNQGEFPASVTDNGLLLKADRIRLEEAGLEISDRFNSFAVDENFMFYSAVCSASEKVYILCHRQALDGTFAEQSNIYSRLKKVFGGGNDLDNEFDLPETEDEGFSILARSLECNNPLSVSLTEYFKHEEEQAKRLSNLLNMQKTGEHRILKDTCKKLFGDSLYLSASKIENYNGCAFSFFCRYVLNISPLKKADLDNIQRGTIVHFVMENVLRDYGSDIKNATEKDIKLLVDKYMKSYLEDIVGSEFLKKPRFEFLYSMIAKMSLAVLMHIAEEFKVCSFEPVSFELEISNKGNLPLFKLKFSEGKTLNLSGKIDRVDALKGSGGENFIRVVDYKTGSKEFHLPDILHGLNMQMLVYLSAIKKLGTDLFGEVTPAGVLYKPSKRSVQKEGEEKSLGFAMNGMIINNKEVQNGMDSTNSGKFAPKNTGRARKGNPIISQEDFETVLSFVDKKICTTAEKIVSGIFDINPIKCDGYEACKYCDFASVCAIENKDKIPSVEQLSNNAVLEKMREELGNV